jgi:hypothetical protein
LEAAGLSSRVKVLGTFPLSAGDVAYVKNGQMIGWSADETNALYWRITDIAIRAVTGLKIKPFSPIPESRILNKKNASTALLNPKNYEALYKRAWHLK